MLVVNHDPDYTGFHIHEREDYINCTADLTVWKCKQDEYGGIHIYRKEEP